MADAIQKADEYAQLRLAQFDGGGVSFTSFGQAMEAAKLFASSELVPKALRGRPQDILLVWMKGGELGLRPFQSLAELHVIDGKASASADLLMALCLKRTDLCEFFTMVESSDAKATFSTKRKGALEPVTFSFTIDMAKSAGLSEKQNWKNHRAAMLRARCKSQLARIVYPDVTQGVMSHEELDEVVDVKPERIHSTAELGAVTAPPPPPKKRALKVEPEVAELASGEIDPDEVARQQAVAQAEAALAKETAK